ncbi:MAG TPA: dodecin family protein [Longimicrobiales bacterium]|nr:dodecin family protein [Longimicrobiales bacterium]
MSVAKVIEISAQSPGSIEDAIQKGISRASDTVENIESAWVKETEALVRDDEVHAWRVNLKVTFVIDD